MHGGVLLQLTVSVERVARRRSSACREHVLRYAIESPGGKEPELTRMDVQPSQGSFSLMSMAYDASAVAGGQM